MALQKFYGHLDIEHALSHLLDHLQPDRTFSVGGWEAEVTAN